jgi:hypothetical protein
LDCRERTTGATKHIRPACFSGALLISPTLDRPKRSFGDHKPKLGLTSVQMNLSSYPFGIRVGSFRIWPRFKRYSSATRIEEV